MFTIEIFNISENKVQRQLFTFFLQNKRENVFESKFIAVL